jgi:quinol monooxygenase YgiN
MVVGLNWVQVRLRRMWHSLRLPPTHADGKFLSAVITAIKQKWLRNSSPCVLVSMFRRDSMLPFADCELHAIFRQKFPPGTIGFRMIRVIEDYVTVTVRMVRFFNNEAPSFLRAPSEPHRIRYCKYSPTLPFTVPITIVGFFTFTEAKYFKEFQEAFDKLVVFVQENEPGTTNFSFYEDSEDPLSLMAVEEWVDDAAFVLHTTSEAFKTFFAVVGPMVGMPFPFQSMHKGGIRLAFRCRFRFRYRARLLQFRSSV